MKRSRLRKQSISSLAKLKRQLWQLCRQIIITKYGNTCYTCGAVGLVGSNLQCGHFIPSSVCSVSLRFSLENLRPQCMVCNVHRSGNWPAYEKHLKLDGTDVEALKQHNYDTKGLKYDRLWYTAKIAQYAAMAGEE